MEEEEKKLLTPKLPHRPEEVDGTCLNHLLQLLKDRQADGKKLLLPHKLLLLPSQDMRTLLLIREHLRKEPLQLKITTLIRNLMAGRMVEAMTNHLEPLKL